MADDPSDDAPKPRPGTPDMSAFRRWVREWLTAPDRGNARLLIAGVILFTMVQVAVQIRFNTWNRDFFDALDKRDGAAFQHQILVFLALAPPPWPRRSTSSISSSCSSSAGGNGSPRE